MTLPPSHPVARDTRSFADATALFPWPGFYALTPFSGGSGGTARA